MPTSQQTTKPSSSDVISTAFAEAILEAVQVLKEHQKTGLLRKEASDWLEQFQGRVQQLVQRQSINLPPCKASHGDDEVWGANSRDEVDQALQEMLNANPLLQTDEVVYLS